MQTKIHHTTKSKPRNIYGSSRLGTTKDTLNIFVSNVLPSYGWVGNRQYELSNHLGNVLTTISDIKYPLSDDNVSISGYEVGINGISDYSPFGAGLDGRTVGKLGKYGVGSHEKINEVSGSGNTVDMGDRWLDVRLGRTPKMDAKAAKYPSISPYSYVANNPLIFIDPDGEEIIPVIHRDSKGNINEVEFILTGKVVFKDNINRSDKNKQKITDNINKTIGETWNLTTNEGIPEEWHNSDGTPITFKVTSKLTLADDQTVISDCDHVVYMVAFLPLKIDGLPDGKEVAGHVNGLGGMQMYLVGNSYDSDHEFGHWMGLIHDFQFKNSLEWDNYNQQKKYDIDKITTKAFGNNSVMNWKGGKDITPMLFYISYELSKENLLNSGSNEFHDKENWKNADKNTMSNSKAEFKIKSIINK